MATRGRRAVAVHDGSSLPLVPPANLDFSPEERPHWVAMVRSCARHGYGVDIEAVAQATRRRASLWQLKAAVQGLGSDLLIETSSGVVKLNPLLDALRSAEAAYESSLKVLLLTPRNRQSLRRGVDRETDQVVDTTAAQKKIMRYLG